MYPNNPRFEIIKSSSTCIFTLLKSSLMQLLLLWQWLMWHFLIKIVQWNSTFLKSSSVKKKFFVDLILWKSSSHEIKFKKENSPLFSQFMFLTLSPPYSQTLHYSHLSSQKSFAPLKIPYSPVIYHLSSQLQNPSHSCLILSQYP